MAIFGLEHSTFDPKGSSLSGREKAQYEKGQGRWLERDDVVYSEVGNLPEFAQGDAVAFFAAADDHERVNGRRYTEVVLTMASELTDEQNIEEGKKWVRENLGTAHPYILALHKPMRLRTDPEAQAELDQLRKKPGVTEEEIRKAEQQMFQPHSHVLYTERTLTTENYGMSPEKWFSRIGAKKDRKWHDKDLIPRLREAWSAQVNQALETHAPDAKRVDHRSLKVQRAEAVQKAIREVLDLHKLPEEERHQELERVAVQVAVLDREPEGRMSGVERSLAKEVASRDRTKVRPKSKRQQRGEALKKNLDESFEKRRAEPTPEAIAKAEKQIAQPISMLSKMRQACFTAVQLVRDLRRELRRRLEAQRRAVALSAAKAVVEVASEPTKAQCSNAIIRYVAEAVANGRAELDRIAALISADAVFGMGTGKANRTYGLGRGAELVKDAEKATAEHFDGKKSVALRDLGNLEIERIASGFKYAIIPKPGKALDLASELSEGAKRQLKYDNKILAKKQAKVEEKEQKRPGLGR